MPRQRWTASNLVGLTLDLLRADGFPYELSYETRRSGKRLLRGVHGRIEVVPLDSGGWEILAHPDPEYLVPSIAETLQLTHRALALLATGFVQQGVSATAAPVTLHSISPVVDIAACPLSFDDLQRLPGVTDRVAEIVTDRQGDLIGVYGKGWSLYNKTNEIASKPASRYMNDVHARAGVRPEDRPIWRLDGNVGPRPLATCPWPPDIAALHRGVVRRFVSLGTGLPAGSPNLEALLATPPWSIFLSPKFPRLDVPGGQPTLMPWSVELRVRRAFGYATYVAADLSAAFGLVPLSLQDALRMLADAPQLATPAAERAFQAKLAIARDRHAAPRSTDDLPLPPEPSL